MTNYSLVTTDYCDTDITSRAECTTAAYHLGLPDTSSQATFSSDRPYGCISSRNTGTLQWNVLEGPSCGTIDDGNNQEIWDCVCGPAGNIEIHTTMKNGSAFTILPTVNNSNCYLYIHANPK